MKELRVTKNTLPETKVLGRIMSEKFFQVVFLGTFRDWPCYFVTLGIWSKRDDAYKAYKQSVSKFIGKILDCNGERKFSVDKWTDSAMDRLYQGHVVPQIIHPEGQKLYWKGFDRSILFENVDTETSVNFLEVRILIQKVKTNKNVKKLGVNNLPSRL